ncbi:hypothetical protein AMECASPLE_024198 [Ameca splendens]|uniref:Uncharacterized protein n=1 Tax=Ameca splendens TaxID=208324 RepID=A0ABV0ZQI3_9TELE
MGSVSECMKSIVVCLYVGCLGVFLCVRMRVGMCDCDCVCLFLVSGWVLGCSLSWISLGTPSHGGLFPTLTPLPFFHWLDLASPEQLRPALHVVCCISIELLLLR